MHKLLLPALGTALLCPFAVADPLPPVGQWDGVTSSAKLDVPYENPMQVGPPFGIVSFFNHPWRYYMDTWPATRFLETPGANWNVDPKYADSLGQILDESGLRTVRVEIGWGNMGWDDDLPQDRKAQIAAQLKALQKHHIRPMILLNCHHGGPGPMRQFDVSVAADAKKGDRTLKLRPEDTAKIHVGYTGPMNPDYIAADPLITSVDADGTCHLSAGLGGDVKAGKFSLFELKYRPFQGVKLKGGSEADNARVAGEAHATADGWARYAASVGKFARETLGTPTDSGFDIEVWNEQTFGANFLNINNYYDEKLDFSEPLSYTKTRALTPDMRPDAQTQFKSEGAYVILPMTIDYFNDPANGFHNVKVVSGFANQWPWDSGTTLWNGQTGFSRHYYTGYYQDVKADGSPISQVGAGAIDALGGFDGTHDNKDWHTILPGTKYIPPPFRIGMPEFMHTGFKTESLTRDVFPDSRFSGMGGHGRYTHNGDFRPAELWQTEVNYARAPWSDELAQAAGVKEDDPRFLALMGRMAGKTLFRQYFFHNHKGLTRIYMFALSPAMNNFGMFPPAFYDAIDKAGNKITPAVRAAEPPEWKGMTWITRQIETGSQPDIQPAPRPLRVDGIVEYKPRLVFAGDGTPRHPHQWNRDWFAFLPYQLAANKFLIPYYVATLDMTHSYDAKKNPLDPARYDMPDQEFEVTIGNCAGKGAKVSAYDPLSNAAVPVQVVSSTPATLTVRLKTVDYPRVLMVEEAKVGPQILDPKVVTDGAGKLTVSWKTNVPVNAAKVTYGKDWMNRSAQEIVLKGGANAYSINIPTGQKGILAARIKVTTNGLSDVWPRWDEDPQGQVVVPGSTKDDVKAAPPAPPRATGTLAAVALTMPAGAKLPLLEANAARGYRFRLPEGAVLTGVPDDREGALGQGANAVRLRVRYLPGAASAANQYLPVASAIDASSLMPVTLSDHTAATLATFDLADAAHPGMTNLGQRFLLIPTGKDNGDLLLLSASGTPQAVKANDALIKAVFASVTLDAPKG